MITLITGTPGAGKTAWIVNEMLKPGFDADRRVFVHAIPDFKLPHEPVYCHSPLCDHCRSVKIREGSIYVEDWHEWATDGSLIVIDEVQRVWRPRGPAQKVPDAVAKLETHRHRGIDFWIVSQRASLFDTNVRGLTSKHVHLVSTWKGRKEYEWPECKDNTSSTSDAVERPYRLNARAFALYRSASLHTKVSHRRPLAFYALFALVAVIGYIGVHFYQRFTGGSPLYGRSEVAGTNPGVALPGAKPQDAQPLGLPSASKTDVYDEAQWQPAIKGRPETAPVYQPLMKVVDYPYPSACVSTKSRCSCYTGQGTVYPVSEAYCREMATGHVFNPYVAKPPMNPLPTHRSETIETISPASEHES
jgi:zona occludens toxin